MKVDKLFIAAFLIILGSCNFTYGQIPELKKFEFMKGEFRSRGSQDGILKADFSKNGDGFSWTNKSTLNDEFGIVSFDAPTRSYRLKEKFRSYIEPFYYTGNKTNEGFHFYELTTINGVIKENGNEVLIRPLEPGIFNIEHFYDHYGKKKPKQWIPSRYYRKVLSGEQLAKQIRKAIGKLDFLVGKFVSDDGTSEFIGKFIDAGKTYVGTFKSPERTSQAIIKYDFHWDDYSLTETVKPPGDPKISVLYKGYFRENGNLDLYARINSTETKLTLSSPGKNKVSILVTKYGKNSQKETFYTKLQ